MSATVILSYSVQNFKTIWLNEKSFGPTKFNEIWANKVITVKTGTFDVSITDRCSSEEIIQVPQGISSAIFNYVDGSVNWIQINMKRKTTCLTLYSTLWLLMAYSIMRCYAICRDSEYLLRTQYIMMRKWLLLSPAPFPSCRNVTLGHMSCNLHEGVFRHVYQAILAKYKSWITCISKQFALCFMNLWVVNVCLLLIDLEQISLIFGQSSWPREICWLKSYLEANDFPHSQWRNHTRHTIDFWADVFFFFFWWGALMRSGKNTALQCA